MTVQCDYTLLEYSEALYEMKKKPMLFFKIMAGVLLALGIAGAVYNITAKGGTDSYIWFLSILALATGLLLVIIEVLSLPNIFGKRLVRTNPDLKDGMKQSFIFNENGFEVREMAGTHTGDQKMKYSELAKACESKNFLFLYVNSLTAYPLKKSALSEEELKELKKILTAKVAKTNMKSAE